MSNRETIYKKMYFHLFNVCEDAAKMLMDSYYMQENRSLEAVHMLINALNSCEEIYISNDNNAGNMVDNPG